MYKVYLVKGGYRACLGNSISRGRNSNAKTEERMCLQYLLNIKKATKDRDKECVRNSRLHHIF